MTNYLNCKNGVIFVGSKTPGNGKVVGNIYRGVLRRGSSHSIKSGTVVGNVKDNFVYEGGNSSIGSGHKIARIKSGYICTMSGEKLKKIKDVEVYGAEGFDETLIAAIDFFFGGFA